MAVITARALFRPVTYPESDGKPMAETERHLKQMIYLLEVLEEYFRQDAQVYVVGNLLMYYEERDPRKRVAPNVMVVWGIPKVERRVYKVWEEEKGPDFVVEVTSRGTRREDMGKKWRIYERLGVREYFLFDPLGEYLRPVLQGYRLVGGMYQPLWYEAGSAGVLRVQSEVAGVVLQVEDGWLWLYDVVTGERLRGLAQEAAVRREAEAQATKEAEARRVAEEEVARLRAELERLRRGRQ